MSLRVGIVAYQGVLADESGAFRDVLRRIPGSIVLTVGARPGIVAGPGGIQRVDVTFDDVRTADVVVVPGGLGSHRHPEIIDWLDRVHPEWILTSSTGSALLAASGLLRGRTAATHWLAGPLLERHGVTVSDDRLVVDEPFVTAAGVTSAYDASFVVVRRVGGPALVARIRAEMADDRDPGVCTRPVVARRRPARRSARAIDVAGSVEVELEVTRRR